ncbi:hypothetical protein SISSUDRAFT_1067164 [Sistotremastrum suecicum HHB10207 ss-3]|uniref:Uncharacterized protein n=1 Tax=Sistotremastrum suecicum HHB10207 ss-3 TaxID=1314776 RepID=A0A165XFU0_9AGAM|nr:hypothetical protein SISSUDRAFT_1067164 [Sistotremastrum suecicum HHB10207 ss-3]
MPSSNRSSNSHRRRQEPLVEESDEDDITAAAERELEAMSGKFGSKTKRTREESEIVQTCHAALRRFAAYGKTAGDLMVSIIMSDPERKKKDAETERLWQIRFEEVTWLFTATGLDKYRRYLELQDPEKPFHEKLTFLSRWYDLGRGEGKNSDTSSIKKAIACGFKLSEDNPGHIKWNPSLSPDDRSTWGWKHEQIRPYIKMLGQETLSDDEYATQQAGKTPAYNELFMYMWENCVMPNPDEPMEGFLQTRLLVNVWKWLHLGWRGKADPGHGRESQKYLLTLRSIIYVAHLVYFVFSGEERRGDGFQLERHYWYLDAMLAKEEAASKAMLKWWRKQIWLDDNDDTPSDQPQVLAGGYAVILARRKAAQAAQRTSTPAAQPATGPVVIPSQEPPAANARTTSRPSSATRIRSSTSHQPSSSPRPHRTSDTAVDEHSATEEDDIDYLQALTKIIGKNPRAARGALKQLQNIARTQDVSQADEILLSQFSPTRDSQLSETRTQDSQVYPDSRRKQNKVRPRAENLSPSGNTPKRPRIR